MKGFYLIAAAAVVLLVLSPFVLLDAQQSDRFAGKVVFYNVYGAKVNSMDPATCGDTTSAAVQGYIYEGLYTYHYLKRPVEVIPLLAESLPEISQDALTYTIRLKKGVKYARNPCFGTDRAGAYKTRTVTADDFVLAFKRVADYHVTTKLSLAFIEDRIVGLDEYRKKTRRYLRGDFSRYDKEDLPGVKALDEHTLQIRLKKRFPQLLYVLAMTSYAPIPRELIDYHLASRPAGEDGRREPIPMDERSTEIHDHKAAVGTGPYVLTEWVRASKMVMERNVDFRDDYYPSQGAPGDREANLLDDAGRKVPFIDVRYLVYVAEGNPAWMLLLSKQRDSGGIPRDAFTSVISPSRELTDKWRQRGLRLAKDPYPAIYWLAFNMDDKVVGASKSLRQGLSLGFNVEEYVKVLHNNRGIRAVNIIPQMFKGHAEAGEGPYAHYDLEAAREKIAQAREELVAAGVIGPGEDIPKIVLDLGGRDEGSRRLGAFVVGQFSKLGVTVKVELNDWPTLQEKVHNKQTQIYTMGWHADYPDAENFLQNFYSPNIKRGTNNTNYNNPEFDKLFAQAAQEIDIDKRVPLYAKMSRMLSEDCPVLLLTEPISFALIYDWVHNSKPHPVAYGQGKYIRLDVAARRRAGGRE